MRRIRWIGGSLVAIALTMSACSDDGTQTLSDDDFVDQMNDICSDADNDLGDLDQDDSSFLDDVLDIIDTALEDFAELTAPDELEDDFDDFVSNLEDQRSEFENIGEAIEDGDTDALTEASANLAELAGEGDELADSIGADDCVGVGESIGGTPTPPESTEPQETTAPSASETTTASETTEPAGTTPNTPLPIDTTPVPTEPPPTEPPVMTEPPMDPNATGEALDASQIWAPPAGYEWGVLENLAGFPTPSGDPVLGPILVAYSSGIVHSTSDGPSAIFFITEVNSAPWTDEQLSAMYTFSFGTVEGTEATTPLGLPAVTAPVEDFYGGMAWIDGAAIAVLTPVPEAVLPLIDEFYLANTMGG